MRNQSLLVKVAIRSHNHQRNCHALQSKRSQTRDSTRRLRRSISTSKAMIGMVLRDFLVLYSSKQCARLTLRIATSLMSMKQVSRWPTNRHIHASLTVSNSFKSSNTYQTLSSALESLKIQCKASAINKSRLSWGSTTLEEWQISSKRKQRRKDYSKSNKKR